MNTKNIKKYCSVSGCKGCSIKEQRSFHLPPLDRDTYNKWCIALKVKILPKKATICSKHFSPADYFPAANGNKRFLKKGAVPTQNLPVSLLTSVSKDPGLAEKRKKRLINRNVKKLKSLDQESEKTRKELNDTIEDEGSAIEDDTTTDLHYQNIGNNVNVDAQSNTPVDDPTAEEQVDVKVDKNVQVTISDNQERKTKITILDFLDNDKKLNTYTGIKSVEVLNTIVECISELRKAEKKRVIRMSIKDSVLLTFIKLKQNQTYSALGILFNIDYRKCKKCFINTLVELVKVLSVLIRWPGKEEILNNMPKCFNKYKSTRIVLDCLEIPIRQSKCLKCRIPTYSNYKARHTVKFLVGGTPSGMISYVSKGYGGRVSDKFIFNKSGMLKRMIRCVDAIMVDRGFLIDQECAEYGIKLIRPPFLKKKQQLTGKEAMMNANIASARVHVERRIQRLRLFRILQGPLETEVVPYINIIMRVICAVTNLDSPILSADKFISNSS